MTPVERLHAAIDKLEALRTASGTEPWTWGTGRDLGASVRSEQFGYRFSTGYVGNRSSRNDAELIVTLHRTIDAQLAILRSELDFVARCGWPTQPFPERLAVLALADAILGSES